MYITVLSFPKVYFKKKALIFKPLPSLAAESYRKLSQDLVLTFQLASAMAQWSQEFCFRLGMV
jgi:hypothetical protein